MITNEERRIAILKYVMDRQKAKQNTNKNTVIEYMKQNRLSSRQTTHNLLIELINEGKLNKQEINNQIHFLTVNKNWDKMQEELLKSQIEKTLEQFPDFTVSIRKKKFTSKDIVKAWQPYKEKDKKIVKNV